MISDLLNTYVYPLFYSLETEPLKGYAFGKEEWLHYFNYHIDDEPDLPENIVQILNGPSPTDGAKTVRDTHILTLIPKGLTLIHFGQLVKNRFCGKETEEIIRDPHLNVPVEKSYWTLMTNDILKESRGRNSNEAQVALLEELSKKANAKYTFPKVLEAVVSILAHEASTKKQLFSNDPWTFTQCLEIIDIFYIYVGGFSSEGLQISSEAAVGDAGTAGLRKF